MDRLGLSALHGSWLHKLTHSIGVSEVFVLSWLSRYKQGDEDEEDGLLNLPHGYLPR